MKNDSVPRGDFTVSNHVYIGNDVKINNNSEIGKNTVLCDDVTIGKNTRIVGSVVYPNCVIGDNCIIENSVICPDVIINNQTRIYPYCCIGESVKIGKGCSLFSYVRVKNNLEICDFSAVSRSVEKSIKTDRISSVSNSFIADVDCFFSLELGCAVGSALCGSKLAVATDGNPKAKAILSSFVSGVSLTGTQCWFFGDAFYSQMFFFTQFCSLPLGVYFFGDGDTVNVKICSTGGLPMKRDTERRITKYLNSKDYNFSLSSNIKVPVEMNSAGSIYSSVLFRQSESSLSKIRVKTDTKNDKILCIVEDCIKRLEGETEGETVIHISSDGTLLSVTENNVEYTCEDVLSVLLYYETKNGNDISLDFFSPKVYSSVASLHNRKIFFYLSSCADSSDFDAREKAKGQLWTRDALFMAIRLLSLMHEENKSLSELKRDVPDFYVSREETEIDFLPTKLFEIFSDYGNIGFGEGISVKKNGAKAIVLPSSDGRKIKILAESFDTETAEELCSELTDKIKSFGADSST
jgi:phosphomannomutase